MANKIKASNIDTNAITADSISYPLTTFSSTGIDDNATSTAITIDSSNNVGIGTASPATAVALHVYKATGDANIILEAAEDSSNTEAKLLLKSYNTSSQPAIFFGDNAAYNGKITYENANDAMVITTNGSERMRIDSSGNIGIGTSAATTARLAVVDGKTGTEASPHIGISGNGYNGYHWLDTNAYYIGQNSNARSLRIYSGTNEAAGAQLQAGGTSFGTYSDERLKKDITDLTNGLNKILALRPVNFKYKSDADDYRNRIGIIAQSIVGQVDEALDQTKITADDETEYYNVRYQDLIPVLVKGMQEQQTKIEELEARITALETQS